MVVIRNLNVARLQKVHEGIALGVRKMAEEERIKKDILAFCKVHDFFVHPAKSLDEHIKRVVSIGGCPCDLRRRTCPCEQAVEEIEQGRGSCACTILVSDVYLREWHYTDDGMPLYLRKRRKPITLFKRE